MEVKDFGTQSNPVRIKEIKPDGIGLPKEKKKKERKEGEKSKAEIIAELEARL